MPRELLLTDIDNTLYDWNSFFASAFRGMVHALSREMRVDEEVLIEGFREVFHKHGNVEYAFAIQELDLVDGLSDEGVRALIRVGRGAFTRVRNSRLRPYAGVLETLKWVSEQGIAIVAVSNAPLYVGQLRLNELKLDRYIDGMVAWEGSALPDVEESARFMEGFRPREGPRRRSAIGWTATVRSNDRKPSTHPYRLAMRQFGASPDRVWALGDSLVNDLLPAQELGVTSILASYGAAVSEKNYETLLRVTHWTAQDIESQYRAAPITPDFIVEDIARLRDILPLNNPTLF